MERLEQLTLRLREISEHLEKGNQLTDETIGEYEKIIVEIKSELLKIMHENEDLPLPKSLLANIGLTGTFFN